MTSDSAFELLARQRPPREALRWAAMSIGRGAKVVSLRRRRGGSSTAVHAIDVEDRRGRRHRLVLRRFVRTNWQRPDLARREASVLELLRNAAVPAPQLLAADADAAACDVPALLMTRLSGRIDLTPKEMRGWLGQMAEALPPVHDLRVASGRVQAYRPYTDPRKVDVPPWSRRPKAWQKVLGLARAPRLKTPRCFIHRDYHPTNLLWSRGRISGIVDWINASMGPPEIDVAHCRRNLVALYGVAVADEFLDAYQELLGRTRHDYHPYWDAIAVADSGLVSDPDVFSGWRGLGPKGLTKELIQARLDEYAVSIAARC